MSKAHLFAPMEWVKEQFNKLNSNTECVELTEDDIVCTNGTTMKNFVGYKYKNRIEFSCFLQRPATSGVSFIQFKNVKCKGSFVNVQPRQDTYIALKAMVQGNPNNALYITTSMETAYTNALDCWVNGIVFLEE